MCSLLDVSSGSHIDRKSTLNGDRHLEQGRGVGEEFDLQLLDDIDIACFLDATPSPASWLLGEPEAEALTSSNQGTTPSLTCQPELRPHTETNYTATRQLSSKAVEGSRKSQKRYRERQKARFQQLQHELDASKAVIAQLQSEKVSSARQRLVVSSTHPTILPKPQVQHIAWQTPDTLHCSVTEVLHTPWAKLGALMTCDLLPHEAEACQHIASLTLPELAIIRQGYVKRISNLLLTTGPDTSGPAGAQLEQLEHEFCCLHAVKTRVTPEDWAGFYNYSGMHEHALQGWDTCMSDSDWSALFRMLQLTAAQKASISALRTAYITKVSLLAKQRRQLLWMLQQMPAVKAGHSQLEATRNAEENIAQKLQGLVTTENKLFVELSSNVGHGVLTEWQGCVGICHAFPKSPDVLALMEAVAKEAGEPPAETLSASIQDSTVDEDLHQHPVRAGHFGDMHCRGSTTKLCMTAGLVTDDEVTPQQIFG